MTQDSIRTIVARIEERLIAVADRQVVIAEDVKETRADLQDHTEKDEKRFDSLYKYGAAFGAACIAIGWAIKVLAG